MSSVLDIKMKALARRLIDQYGKVCQVEFSPARSYDPTIGKPVESTSIKKSIKLTPPYPASTQWWASTTVQSGDMEAWATVEPGITFEVGMRLKVNNDWWKVIQVNQAFSGDDVALFGLLMRR